MFAACIRSAMLCGSETSAVKEEDVCRLRHTEISIFRWMCSESLNDRPDGVQIQNEDLRRMELECIRVVMRMGRLK